MNHNNRLSWLQRPVHPALPAITIEIALFAGIVLLAILTRFYDLGARVMSHDESLHTYFSWLLYRGQGYQHSPMMHGPWQFHWIALSYFFFGVSDFTARIPAALFSIASVAMVWYWRRYLGKTGALIAGLLLVVSPYMLYYGRYVRNESYAGLAGILLLYAILRYLENGDKRYLYLVTAATLLHFTAKETAFIYTAQAMVFLGVYFVVRITKAPWEDHRELFKGFILVLVAAAILLGAGAAIAYANRPPESLSGTETAAPANPTDSLATPTPTNNGSSILSTGLLAAGALAFVIAGLIYFFQAYIWHNISKERAFDLMLLLGTFVLPMTTALPIKLFEDRLNVAIPTDSASVSNLDPRTVWIVGSFVLGFFVLSIVVGMLWNRDWWKYGIAFWGLFTIFYTTVFTNAAGFFTGIVGSLGYWLVQQGVERGSQPEYYYLLVQIPMYEFLPAIGTLLAMGLGLKKLIDQQAILPENAPVGQVNDRAEAGVESGGASFGVFFGLTIWWVISSILAFTIAGERMPWLTYHMTWPMILMSGWAIGQVIDGVVSQTVLEKPQKVWLAILLLIVFVIAGLNVWRSLFGAQPPFQGSELAQLQASAALLFPLIALILTGALLAYLLREDLVSLGIVLLMILALIILGSSIISGASALERTAATADPINLTRSWLRFGATLLVLIGSLIGIVFLFRSRPPGADDRVSLGIGFLLCLAILTSVASAMIGRSLLVPTSATAETIDLTQSWLQFGATLLALVGSLIGIVFLFRSRRPAADDRVSLGIGFLLCLAILTFGASVMIGPSVIAQTAAATPDPASIHLGWLQFGAMLLAFIGILIGMILLLQQPRPTALVGLFSLTVLGLLFVQTVRSAVRAAYIDYDNATEYLVYAHGARGVKDVMAQVEEVSERTAGGFNAVVAYDSSPPDTGVSWPFVWYLRDYTALRSFDKPTRSLRDAVAVIVDQKNFDTINAALGDEFYEFDYIRMWWPNQDYFNLDKTRVLNAITDPQIREGIFDIWLDRDYTQYAQAIGSNSMTLTTWQPADQMKLFVRKDVAAKIWNYGVGPAAAPVASDPYEAGTVMLAADQIFGADRYPPLGLNAPRAIAVGRNGDLYVTDSRNHRILHISSDGNLLDEWGKFADAQTGDAPAGTFYEPWGVAVGPDGSVYVTDTWNHRVQKFTEDGQLITMWGQYGQPSVEIPESKSFFWGPRGIAVDWQGHVFVADTGNKRIVIFDEDGKYLTEFGTAGLDAGQFDEPVGVAVADDGTVFVTDTWNQRIQSFIPDEAGLFYFPSQQWDVNAWFGQSLENKPFIAVSEDKHVFITDPEGYRVIEFTDAGEFVRAWGDFGAGAAEIGLAAGVAIDPNGFVWVTDAGNNRILRYTLP